MKIQHSKSKTIGVLSLAALLGASALSAISPVRVAAQPDAGIAKAQNPPNRKKGQRKNKGKKNREANAQKMLAREITRLETALGKPLTTEQKIKVQEALAERIKVTQQAQEDYLKSVAETTGLTVDELQMQMRGARRKEREKNAQPAAEAAAAAPAAN